VAAERSRGSPDPLAREIAAHVGALRRYALALTADPREADDLVRECLGRVLPQVRAWRAPRDLRVHLFAAMHDAFVDPGRKRRTRAAHAPGEDVLVRLPLPAGQPRRREPRAVAQALAALPGPQREVVLLVGLEGMSYPEAARVLGVPVGTVTARLSRGRAALHRLMAHDAVVRPPVAASGASR
jgi:RNA polymerase sigma-70 factor (ECF subfamily)